MFDLQCHNSLDIIHHILIVVVTVLNLSLDKIFVPRRELNETCLVWTLTASFACYLFGYFCDSHTNCEKSTILLFFSPSVVEKQLFLWSQSARGFPLSVQIRLPLNRTRKYQSILVILIASGCKSWARLLSTLPKYLTWKWETGKHG